MEAELSVGAAIRAEHKLILQEALNGMDSIDREVLTLRHFELLNNEETALVLGLTNKAASNRYVRALRRLKEILQQVPVIPLPSPAGTWVHNPRLEIGFPVKAFMGTFTLGRASVH